jgi:hypothetical protein
MFDVRRSQAILPIGGQSWPANGDDRCKAREHLYKHRLDDLFVLDNEQACGAPREANMHASRIDSSKKAVKSALNPRR